MIALMHNGRPVPFGAVVTRSDEGGDTIVGDNGEAYLLAGRDRSLTAQWGDTDDKNVLPFTS